MMFHQFDVGLDDGGENIGCLNLVVGLLLGLVAVALFGLLAWMLK